MAESDKTRARAGIITSAVGIACNLALAAAKIATGAVFGLVSVMADGFNNLSDCGSSAVALVSFKISEKPADEEHPYGHRRAEYVASMIIGFFVLFVAVELFRESIDKVLEGIMPDGSWIVYTVLAASIAVKAAMFAYYRVMAKKLQSDTLRAAATDSACDCLSTLAVIAGMLVSQFAEVPADGWAGLAVALFIFWQGIKILIEAGSKLLGQAPDKAFLNGIRSVIVGEQSVLGVHDLRVYGYGKGAYYATVHIEMDAAVPPLEAHALIDGLEHAVKEKLGVELCAHLDPVDLTDGEAREIEVKVRAAVEGLEDGLKLHDFRLVRGVKNKIIFDAGVPYSCKTKDGELRRKIEEAARSVSDAEPVVTVERELI